MYAKCVCPDTMASTSGETVLTMSPHTVPAWFIVAQFVDGAPSCTSITTTSAPCATRSAASVLTEVTIFSTAMSAMPPGLTSAGSSSVTAPTKPTWTSPKSLIHVAGTASSPVAFSFRFAAMYFHCAPPKGLVVASYGAITRLTRSL